MSEAWPEISYDFECHREKEWFKRANELNGVYKEVYTYGIKYLKQYRDRFFAGNFDKAQPYQTGYFTNPFVYQYDMTMFIWTDYYHILKNEIKTLRRLAKEENNEKHNYDADQLEQTRTLYGISREDFWFAAAEMRWPVEELPNGALHGLLVRDPWSNMRMNAYSDEKIKDVYSFGGGGQGKTHVSLAFALTIFDHFLFTEKGARCMLSTTSEDKLNSVGWAYLSRLNSATLPGISLYAGRAKIAGDNTLMRPENKDKGGVFKGILIGNQINPQKIVDKLTGSHGHPWVVYILDEMQSTPDPPLRAAPNFTMHAGDHRILGAGNWGINSDTLANNVKPVGGWETVNENTKRWKSVNQNGQTAIVLHFNNNNSPGMTDDGAVLYPHLPSEAKLNKLYPNKASRNPVTNEAFRRFWLGWRIEAGGERNVIYEKLVRMNMADQPLRFKQFLHRFFSFDSAPAELDRNMMTIIDEGIDEGTDQRVFGPSQFIGLTKSTDSLKYYEESSNEIIKKCKELNIVSGSAILDWTGRPAHAERLQAKGFLTHQLIYNKGIPDGKTRDKHSGRVERAILLNIQLDYRNDIAPEATYAHHVAENNISLGAWAFREYVKANRVRNLTPEVIQYVSERSIEEEFYNREFFIKNSKTYGDRFELQSKLIFKKTYGFSPDLLDTLFQAAYYMLVIRNLPLTTIANDDIVTRLSAPKDDEIDWDSLHDDEFNQLQELG